MQYLLTIAFAYLYVTIFTPELNAQTPLQVSLQEKSRTVRDYLLREEKKSENLYKDQFKFSKDLDTQIIAAVYFGVLNRSRDPLQSQKYFAEASRLRGQFFTHYLPSMDRFIIQKSESIDSESLELLVKLLEKPKDLPWRMIKNGYELALDAYMSRGSERLYLNMLSEYFSNLPNSTLDTKFLNHGAKLLASQEHKNLKRTRLLEVSASWFPLTQESIWAFNQLSNLAKEGEYRFKLRFLRRIYLNGGDNLEAKQQILATIRNPKKMTRGSIHTNDFELIKFLVRIRQYKEAQEIVSSIDSEVGSREYWLLKQWQAFIWGRTGEFQKSVATYEDVILNSALESTDFLENYSENLMKSRRHAQAASKYRKALSHNENYRVRWYSIWNSYAGLLSEDANRLLNEEKSPFNRSYLNRHAKDYWLSKIMSRQGLTHEAHQHLSKVYDSKGFSYYKVLADVEFEQSRFIHARRDIVKDISDRTIAYQAQPSSKKVQKKTKVMSSNPLTLFSAVIHSMEMSPSDLAEDIDHERLVSRYPEILRPVVYEISNSLELDPHLLYALMKAESSFNAKAVSHVGARGIMQMMPYTAVKLADYLEDHNFTMDELSDPAYSIFYGATYFKMLFELYDQNPFVALAAYNAGPEAVNSWLQGCTHCSVQDFVELIPFKETRLYVKKVIKNYSAYKKIYNDEKIVEKIPDLPLPPTKEEIFF